MNRCQFIAELNKSMREEFGTGYIGKASEAWGIHRNTLSGFIKGRLFQPHHTILAFMGMKMVDTYAFNDVLAQDRR